MARLPRLALPGFVHYVIQRGHNGQPVFLDSVDRSLYLAAITAAAAVEPVQLHAWALLDTEVQLMATPGSASALSRFMQAVNRRYVTVFNKRHGRSGTLWDGRFRAAVVEPGALRLQVLALIDSVGADHAPTSTPARQRLGGAHEPLVADPPEYWSLGNTPFEREAAYRALLADGVAPATAALLRRAALGGWVAGLTSSALQRADEGGRPLTPRRRGRPRLAAL